MLKYSNFIPTCIVGICAYQRAESEGYRERKTYPRSRK